MAAVQLVRAVRTDDSDRDGAQRPHQVGGQVERRLVGPVQILDDDQHRAAAGQPLEHPQHQLEQLGALHDRRRARVASGCGSMLGSRRSNADRAGPSASSNSTRGIDRANARNASTSGAKGTPSAPSSTH